jgi:DNA-binding transcriptional LysR family regulator
MAAALHLRKGFRIGLGPSWNQPHAKPLQKYHPLVELEIHHEERLIDVVAQGCDAGIRLSKTVPGDMIGVRFGKPLRWIAVASPAYIEQRGRPEHPTDLMAHRCIRIRMQR